MILFLWLETITLVGGIYNLSGELDSAIYSYKKGFSYNKNSHDKGLQSIILNNIAEVYLEQKKMDEALNYIHLAINIRQKKGDAKHLNSLETLSKYFMKTQVWDSALYYAQKVFAEAVRVGEKNYMRKSAHNISIIYRNQNRYDSALAYYEKYKITTDSIYNMEKSKLFTSLQIQLATQEKESEIKELIQKEEYNKIVIYTMGVIILLVLIAAYLLYSTLKTRHQKKQLQLTADKQLLEQRIEHNKNELFNLTLNMLNKNNCLLEVEEALKKAIQNGGAVLKPDKIIKSIEINRTSDKDWENFNKYFGVVHEEFFNLLRVECPDLSTNEIRLCTLLKLHLSNKEVAKILYIEPNSVI